MPKVRERAEAEFENTVTMSKTLAVTGEVTCATTLAVTGEVTLSNNLVLTDSDVAHGVTNVAVTSAYAQLSPIHGTQGGLYINGLSDQESADARSLVLRGISNDAHTDTVPLVEIIGAKRSGTTIQALAAAETVMTVANHTTDLLTVLGSGAATLTNTLVGHRVLVESVTADDTLTAAESGKTFVFADAAAVLTLPDSGAGDIIGVNYTFISNFQGTGQKVVCTDTTNEDMVGTLQAADNDAVTTNRTWVALVANAFASINITGVAQGHPGSRWTVTNIAADVWYVTGTMIQSGGSEATPFATT